MHVYSQTHKHTQTFSLTHTYIHIVVPKKITKQFEVFQVLEIEVLFMNVKWHDLHMFWHHMCEMTHSYVWRDSFICETWRIHTLDITSMKSDVRHVSCEQVILKSHVLHMKKFDVSPTK